MDFKSIDWEAMWKAEYGSSTVKKLSRKETWDQRADRYSHHIDRIMEGQEKLDKNDYISQMLERIEIKPGWSVLDIGSGPGTLAIPLAKKAGLVTALDISAEMLKHLKSNAENNHLPNIRCLNASWEEAFTQKQVEPHDVVIASRSLVTDDIKKALSGIIKFSRIAAYITYPVVHLPFDWEVYRVIGRSGKKHPPYIYLYNLLFQMGIEANIEMLYSKVKVHFSSFEQAVEELQWRNDPFNTEEISRLRDYWNSKFSNSKEDSGFTHEGESKWALIWWKNR